eukprot:2292008-Prymnesium_polylepis.2
MVRAAADDEERARRLPRAVRRRAMRREQPRAQCLRELALVALVERLPPPLDLRHRVADELGHAGA